MSKTHCVMHLDLKKRVGRRSKFNADENKYRGRSMKIRCCSFVITHEHLCVSTVNRNWWRSMDDNHLEEESAITYLEDLVEYLVDAYSVHQLLQRYSIWISRQRVASTPWPRIHSRRKYSSVDDRVYSMVVAVALRRISSNGSSPNRLWISVPVAPVHCQRYCSSRAALV